jgi:hypothetical protein
MAAKPMARATELGTVSSHSPAVGEGMDDSRAAHLGDPSCKRGRHQPVSVLPVAVWLLRMQNPVIGLICIPLQTMLAIFVTITIIAMNERIRAQEVFFIATIICGFAAALTAAALAARVAGFRLEIGQGGGHEERRDS